jgi:hypothetical protein
MLRLDFSAVPFWIDLVGEARIQVAPFTSAVLTRAQAIGRGNGEPLPEDPVEAVQVHFDRLSVAVACAAILDWEGIGDVDGVPLPVSREAVVGLMSIHECFEAFKVGYMVKAVEILAEKKGFAPSSNGTSGADRIIAVPARKYATTAPMQ